jgi:UDP-glucose 6-dehydrogenase
MKVGVIGGGTVGKAVARTYLEFVDEVRVYDTDPGKTTHGIGHTAFGKVLECNLLFICLPTPQHAMGGGLDVSVVEDFCRSLKGPSARPAVCRRSTACRTSSTPPSS